MSGAPSLAFGPYKGPEIFDDGGGAENPDHPGSGTPSTQVGHAAAATATNSSAFGYGALASGGNATAAGVASGATGTFATAFGAYAQSAYDFATSVGYFSRAGQNGVSVGYNSRTEIAMYGTSVGDTSRVEADYGCAFGANSLVVGESGAAFGHSTYASGYRSSALGGGATATADETTAVGYGTWAPHPGGSAFGTLAEVGEQSVALGAYAAIDNVRSFGVGYGATSSHDDEGILKANVVRIVPSNPDGGPTTLVLRDAVGSEHSVGVTDTGLTYDGSALVGGGTGSTTLDALTDVDTSTTPPTDRQGLVYDAASSLWKPADLTPAAPVGAIDFLAAPPVPPPYAGYAYMDSTTFDLLIWTGTDWRKAATVAYAPGPSDPVALPSLIGRYSALALPYSNSDVVAAWADDSGLHNDLVVTNGGTMVSAGINGHKSVQFDPTTIYELPTAVDSPVTLVAVMQNTDSGDGSVLFSSTGGVAPYSGIIMGGGWRVSDGGAYLDYATPTPTNAHIAATQVDGTGVLVGIDGDKVTSGAVLTPHFKRIGRYETAPSYSMTGLVGELLVYNTRLSLADLNGVIHQLGLDWGITTSV